MVLYGTEHFPFGILNVPHFPITFTRVAGALLLCAGTVLIRWLEEGHLERI
jgi:uncharacterized membrane protein YdcZ (DUF606 family)